MPVLATIVLAAATAAPAPVSTPPCAPARPAQLRSDQTAAQALERYTDLSPAVRDALARRIEQLRVDDLVMLSRDGVSGQYRYDDEIRHALIGGQLCDRLDLSAWKAADRASALVFCEGETCVAMTVDGRMTARLSRRKPDAFDALAQALRVRPGGPQSELALPPPAAGTANGWARQRLLVQTRAGLDDKELARILSPHGGKARRVGRSQLAIVDLPANASETALAQLLARHPQLKSAELDMRVSPAMTPNDPYLGSEWHLTRINAPQAWDTAQGAGIKIAILDTGIDASHPDLAGRLVPGWNFYDGNADTSDVHGHGTAVAGAAAAALNNGIGVASVAGQAQLMPVRIADPNAYAYWSTVAQGLTWAADQGARVANISYSGVAGSTTVQSAADYLRSKGGLVVVSAGNNGIDEGLVPTASMIPVSATDETDTKTSWSSYGSFVALAAPGQNIWTTQRGGSYGAWWGTSFASPVVAGTVALLMSARPSLSGSAIQSALFSTAVDLGAAGRDPYYGWGRVNAAAAMQAVLAAPAPDTQPPAVSVGAPLAGALVSGWVAVDVAASDNQGVARVDLRVNGSVVASDTSAPYGFSWDSTRVANGPVTISAVAVDAAGNTGTSASMTLTVANAVLADTQPPVVAITKPDNNSRVSGNTVTVATSASDNSGAAGIRQSLYVDGVLVASGAGASLSYSWNLKKAANGAHTIQAVARDAAGNTTTATTSVTK
ncbi:S8 family serine peptidase [Mitsuaria sp. GD03876]|uniref:S8 family serine peptidase n=1 Tax=Mitsuaria sp. GD03876 TaxID=2975399 RepID=UPI0024497DCA|nr:S8 family serine peptidase [Mitsuaria sp. GD03876]MDH0868234.1 S8 family serine peptidase [Mitsuaria sp. GD03876]